MYLSKNEKSERTNLQKAANILVLPDRTDICTSVIRPKFERQFLPLGAALPFDFREVGEIHYWKQEFVT